MSRSKATPDWPIPSFLSYSRLSQTCELDHRLQTIKLNHIISISSVFKDFF